MRQFRRGVGRVVFGAILAVAAGCAARRPAVSATETVDSIRFEGNADGRRGSRWQPLDGTSDFNLRNAMEQEQSPVLANVIKPRQRRVPLDRTTLEQDAWRIETWYAHHGYFDARVLMWDVRVKRPARRWSWWQRPARVVITGVVDPGSPTVVDRIHWEGFEALGGPLQSLLVQSAALKQGDRFDIDAVRDTEASIIERLREQGYAYATVETTVAVDPSSGTAEVRIEGVPGIVCTFGGVSVSGELPMKSRYLEDAVELEAGQLYRPSEIRKLERSLFGLGVFGVVNVRPDLSNPEEPVVPLQVELAPSKSRQLRVGGGFAIEPGKQDVHVATGFEHVNLGQRLIRMDVGTVVGLSTITQPTQIIDGDLVIEDVVSTGAPTLLIEGTLTIPRLPARGWELYQDLAFEQGLEPGYRFRTPTLSPGVRGRLTRRVTLDLAYHFRYFDYLDLSLSGADLRRTPLFLDFADPYTLSYLRQQITIDFRDDPLFTRRGSYTSLGFRQAGGALGGQYTYLRAELDQRLYAPIRNIAGWRPRGTLAGRAGLGFIQPYGSDAAAARVPFAERLFLGGATSVRGWPRRQLGPYLYPCGPSGEDYCASRSGVSQPEGELVPIGGLVALQASGEIRALVYDDFGLAAFIDAGMTWNDLESVTEIPLQPTVGGGLRYRTPVGPLRLDVGYRVFDPLEYRQLSRFGIHFSLSEAF